MLDLGDQVPHKTDAAHCLFQAIFSFRFDETNKASHIQYTSQHCILDKCIKLEENNSKSKTSMAIQVKLAGFQGKMQDPPAYLFFHLMLLPPCQNVPFFILFRVFTCNRAKYFQQHRDSSKAYTRRILFSLHAVTILWYLI
jgi:hypothetical protein